MDDRSSGTEPDRSGRARNRTLFVLFGGVLLGAVDIAIVGPALPAIGDTYSLDARALSWIFNVYILVSLISAPLLGTWSDRRGRRPVYLFCLATFGLGSTTVALAPAYPILLIGRAVQALGAGGMLPVASAVVADTFPEHRRGRALGLIGAVFGLAFVIGPLLGAALLEWTWRVLFIVNLPVLVPLVLLARRHLPQVPAPVQRAFDWHGAVALAVALGSTAWLLTRMESIRSMQLAESTSLFGLLAIAVIALVAFLRAETNATSPILSPRLTGSARMRAVSTLALATGFVEATMIFLPTLAVSAFSVTPRTASLMLLPLVAALIVGSVVAGRVLDTIGPTPVIRAGMGLIVLGLGLLALLPPGIAGFYAGGLAVGFGLASLLGAPLRFVAQQEGGTGQRGASQGMLTIFLGAGRLAGAALIGGIVPSGSVEANGFRVAMLVVAGLCAASLLSTRWLAMEPRAQQ